MALGLDDLGRIGGQTARRSDGHDLTLLYSYVALSHIFWGDHQTASDDYIEHRAPPRRMVYCLYLAQQDCASCGTALATSYQNVVQKCTWSPARMPRAWAR